MKILTLILALSLVGCSTTFHIKADEVKITTFKKYLKKEDIKYKREWNER